MMDSQENALVNASPVEEEAKVTNQAAPAPEVSTADAAPQEAAPATEPAAEEQPRRVYQTKQEVLERVKEIAHGEEPPQKDEVEQLKTVFYKLHIAEREANMKAFLDAGGAPEQYQVMPDEDEEVFKAEMSIIKERRQQLFRQQEAEKEANLKRKLEIIEKIKEMVTTPEEASKTYQEFKALQTEWREIKAVPADRANDLWRNYQHYVEQFYDLLKLNSEARELDFKKNMEAKTRLCQEAEKLADETDIIAAFHKLQQLHAEYREIGPVSNELREEVWQRFKAASTVINKRHQQHFEDLRTREEENLAKKVSAVVMNIGEVSTVVPEYLDDCWRWAADREQLLKGAELRCNIIPAVSWCDECKSEYATVQHGRTCPNCGSELDADSDFCEICRHYIRHDVCSFCGAKLSDSDGYCPECGSPHGGIVCPTCHTLNDFSFCKQCGQPLTEEARQLLVKVRESPEYRELAALAQEFNDLQMELPCETERDKLRDEASRMLRERVLKLLAEDMGNSSPVIPAPPRQRMSKEELEEKKKRKMEQLTELLDRMAIPQSPSPVKARNYAMAQKPIGVRLAWQCNYKHALHSSPCGCAKPQLGGKWVILGKNTKKEIKDDI